MLEKNTILQDHYIWFHKVTSQRHGGTKATVDANAIFKACGATPFETTFSRNIGIAFFQFLLLLARFLNFKSNTKFIFQLPQYGRLNKIVARVLLARFKCTILLHDVDEFRSAPKNNTKSTLVMKADKVISTGELLKLIGYTNSANYVVLEFWDYLLNDSVENPNRSLSGNILFAGNLIKNKIPALYALKQRPPLMLYGIKYDSELNENKRDIYMGSFDSDQPSFKSEVSFGLIWEGAENDLVRYELFNQPHKMSLYLALGIPLIVWAEACYAEKVLHEGIGIVVKDLSDIHSELAKVTGEDYELMCINAERLGGAIRNGEFLKAALLSLLK